MATTAHLIVGLANPGSRYADTRHNAGAWLVEAMAQDTGVSLHTETKFHGLAGRVQSTHFLIPTTYMNHSGRAVAALCNYYKIPAEQILIVHDELDFDPGMIKLKQGGGHGGHNGLRDIISALGSAHFSRLRIGIGHPGDKAQVANYVLDPPGRSERQAIDDAITRALALSNDLMQGQWQAAMRTLHQKPTH